MRLLADLNVAPRTVEYLRSLGHDIVRVDRLVPSAASGEEIVRLGAREGRTILTQDLDFSAIVALSGGRSPSVVSLRLASSRVDHVNAVRHRVLPAFEKDLSAGAIVVVEDARVRLRLLPIS